VADGSTHASKGMSKNAPVPSVDPAGSRGALLAAHARTLDTRLRVAAQNERQATRRAAAHVIQLARRIARLLPRVPSLLPVIPDGGRDQRVRHYVLQAQPVAGTGGTRILTISTHSVLRYGEFDGSGKPVLWNEYDPLQPVVGWDLEIVLERLAHVLGQIQEQVERLEERVAERASNLNSLLNKTPIRPAAGPATSTNGGPVGRSHGAHAAHAHAPRPTAPTAQTPPTVPVTPATRTTAAPPTTAPDTPTTQVVYGVGSPTSPSPADKRAAPDSPDLPAPVEDAEILALDDALPELALLDLALGAVADAEIVQMDEGQSSASGATATVATAGDSAPAGAIAPEAPVESTADREKRERRLFQHLRVR
jgi:hypothetical protein